MKGLLRVLLALLALCPFAGAWAEGSRETLQSGGYRAFLEWKDVTTGTTGLVRRTLLHAYAAAGESIDLGSSAKGIGAGNVRWIAPDGSTGDALSRCPAETEGRILNRSQEVLGPATLYAGGYSPCSVVVAAGQTGVWTFEFVSPTPANNFNRTPLLVSEEWTEDPIMGYVAAWDVTVRSGGSERRGRLFTNLLSANVMDGGAGFSAVLYVLTADGYRYSVDPNGMQPFGFHFFANNKGIRQADGNPAYQSGPLGSITSVQHPMAPDDSSNLTHKLFVNPPDSGLPADAVGAFPVNYTSVGSWSYALRSTWLLNLPQAPSVSQFGFVGLEGTPDAMGTAPMGGFFRFQAGQGGSYHAVIDVNGDGVFGNANDRGLAGTVVSGSNQVYWDGLDGLGVPVPATAAALSLSTQVVVGNGEVHFPYVDVEQSPGGLVVTRLNGAGAPDSRIYWNDSALGGTVSLSGVASAPSGAHSWGANFGDQRLIDTWALATPVTAAYSTSLQIREANLRVVSKAASAPVVSQGGQLTWTLVVSNQGPGAVSEAVLVDEFPVEFSALAEASCSVAGGGACGAGGVSGQSYSRRLSLQPGATATVVITSTAVGSGTLTGAVSVSNRAGIQRMSDMKDPDAHTPAPASPTGPVPGPVASLAGVQQQCDSAGGPSCNNLGAASVTLQPTVLLTVDKSNGEGTLTAAQTTRYTITVANQGPGSASGAVLTDEPGPGLNCLAATCLGVSGSGTCPPEGSAAGQLSIGNLLGAGVVLPSLPAGSSVLIGVDCTVAASGL